MSITLHKITDGSPVNTESAPAPVMIAGRPVAKSDPIVSAVRLHLVSGLYAWLDVSKHISGSVSVGYRMRIQGITVTTPQFRRGWEGEIRRHLTRECVNGNVYRVETLRGN